MEKIQLSRKQKAIVVYCLGILICVPSITSAFFEVFRSWWDYNETYFVMLSMLAPIFFFASFYFFKKDFYKNLLMNVVMIWSVFLSIPDINLAYLDQAKFEFREPSFSYGAIVCFIILTWLFIWNRENIGSD